MIIIIMRSSIFIFIVSTSWTRGSQPWRPRWWAGWGFDSWWQFWSVLFYFDLISSLGSSSGNLLRMLSMPWGLTGLAVVLPGGDFCKNKERKWKIRDKMCECGWLQFTRARGWKRWRWRRGGQTHCCLQLQGVSKIQQGKICVFFVFKNHLHIGHWVQRCQRAWTRAWRPAWACFVLGVLEIPRNCVELCVGFIGLPWKVMLWLTMKLTENEINGDTRRNCPHWNKWKLAETHFLFNIATLKL